MPIKPENRARYPVDWPQIVARIRNRASNKCENCGVQNGALGGRVDGVFYPALPRGEMMLRLEWPAPGEYWWCSGHPERLRIIRIVCTTAHLDHTPENCDDDNLRFWCQRCHLRYDRNHHLINARETRRAGRAMADLFAMSEGER